jgi:hypothetical protein
MLTIQNTKKNIITITYTWPAGKGVRNKALMSSKDNHKFKGMSATVSRKAQKKKR